MHFLQLQVRDLRVGAIVVISNVLATCSIVTNALNTFKPPSQASSHHYCT